MAYHVRDYHLVLEKKHASPLTLTERDFEVALEFGGPQEEQRFRDAHRKAQLGLMTTAPLMTTELRQAQTKAADAPPVSMRPEKLAEGLVTVIKGVVSPLRDRVTALEAVIAEAKTTVADARTTVAAAHTRMDRIEEQCAAVTEENAALRKALNLPDAPGDAARVH